MIPQNAPIGDFFQIKVEQGTQYTGYLHRTILGKHKISNAPIRVNNTLEVLVIYGADDCPYGVVLRTPKALTQVSPCKVSVAPKSLNDESPKFEHDMRFEKLGLLIYYSSVSTIVLSASVSSPLVSVVGGTSDAAVEGN